jgi:hypothetical protein
MITTSICTSTSLGSFEPCTSIEIDLTPCPVLLDFFQLPQLFLAKTNSCQLSGQICRHPKGAEFEDDKALKELAVFSLARL